MITVSLKKHACVQALYQQTAGQFSDDYQLIEK